MPILLDSIYNSCNQTNPQSAIHVTGKDNENLDYRGNVYVQ